jgi:hypothetical protein
MAVRLSALRAGRPLPPGRFLVLTSVRGWVDLRAIVRLEGLGQLINPMTSSGVETANSRLAASCLNQLRYCVLCDWHRYHEEMLGRIVGIFADRKPFLESRAELHTGLENFNFSDCCYCTHWTGKFEAFWRLLSNKLQVSSLRWFRFHSFKKNNIWN